METPADIRGWVTGNRRNPAAAQRPREAVSVPGTDGRNGHSLGRRESRSVPHSVSRMNRAHSKERRDHLNHRLKWIGELWSRVPTEDTDAGPNQVEVVLRTQHRTCRARETRRQTREPANDRLEPLKLDSVQWMGRFRLRRLDDSSRG